MKTLLIMMIAAMAMGAPTAHAQAPFGDGIEGVLSADKDAMRCESAVQGGVAKLLSSLLACRQKAVDTAFKGKSTDESACRAAAVTAFVTKADVASCPCVDPSELADLVESAVASAPPSPYCDARGPRLGGDGDGFVPTDKKVLRCQDGIVKCLAKLGNAHGKCHQAKAKRFIAGKPFDVGACDDGPLGGKSAAERYTACTDAVIGKGGCVGCEDAAGLGASIDGALDAAINARIFCMAAGAPDPTPTATPVAARRCCQMKTLVTGAACFDVRDPDVFGVDDCATADAVLDDVPLVGHFGDAVLAPAGETCDGDTGLCSTAPTGLGLCCQVYNGDYNACTLGAQKDCDTLAALIPHFIPGGSVTPYPGERCVFDSDYGYRCVP